jgi:hypothetical protein
MSYRREWRAATAERPLPITRFDGTIAKEEKGDGQNMPKFQGLQVSGTH